MLTLLHIDSSPLYGASVTRELSAAFVNHWIASNPDSSVLERDLTATSIAPIDANWVGAAYTPEKARSAEQTEILALSESLVADWKTLPSMSSVYRCTTSAFRLSSSFGSIRSHGWEGPLFLRTVSQRVCLSVRKPPSSSRRANTMMPKLRWLRSILSSLTCDRSSGFLA